MKCPICGKDLDLQNKQIGTSENGDPIFNEYAICHSCKKQWNLDKQRAKKIAAKKAAEEKAKAEAEARAAEEEGKAEAEARAAEEKAKAEAAARAAEEKAKAEAAARAAEEKRAARREAKARARKEAIARLAADKGFQKRKLSVSLKKEPEHAKPLHRKLPLLPLMLLMIPKSRNMGIFQRKRSVISVKKQFARDTKICLQLILTVKLPRRKRKRKPKLRKQKKM
mgnify:CR=1 FL=1